jgi:hypothetical protein
MGVIVFVVMVMVMVMPMPMVTRAVAVPVAACGVGAVLWFKGMLHGLHDQVHGAQHVGQHVVGFNLQVVGLELNGHMAVAQVVGGSDQVIGCAMGLAVGDAQHLLGRRTHPY